MDWFQWFMLGFGILTAVAFSVNLVKAIQRKQKQRIYDICVDCAVLALLVQQALLPNATHGAAPLVRLMFCVPLALVLANFFGFSQWLFNQHRKRQI